MKRSSLAKSLQFDAEPQKESSSEAQSSERPVPSSLLHLIGQVAETAEDKYRLLEQRDKVLRQGKVPPPKSITGVNMTETLVVGFTLGI